MLFTLGQNYKLFSFFERKMAKFSLRNSKSDCYEKFLVVGRSVCFPFSLYAQGGIVKATEGKVTEGKG
jgi:hypothetical protein